MIIFSIQLKNSTVIYYLKYGFIRAFTKKTQNSFKRINIIIKAAQQDPANSDSLKAALAVLTESLWHHSTSLELAES
jgi:hypothetical protein